MPRPHAAHHEGMTLPDATADRATSALVEALELQHVQLSAVLAAIAAAEDSVVVGASPGSWFGPAERAQALAVRGLARIIDEARTAVERALGDTSSALWEVRSRG